jgi:hypothetical protein
MNGADTSRTFPTVPKRSDASSKRPSKPDEASGREQQLIDRGLKAEGGDEGVRPRRR